ncbi:hypothetical protein E1B03_14660 [Citrobacter arsenatis]|uniref:Uncharacterized protein n=1 Tax=Citrobacter arsenatis TaxID=2546350 RepID=A0A4P6WXA5_9ENTR|nr:hypothetical protein E1B03_14660 [Citrobacter arsenatis]
MRHVVGQHLIWLCHCELPLMVIRDSGVFMVVTLRSMSLLMVTDYPCICPRARFPFSSPLSCHCGDAPCSGRTVADDIQHQQLAW